MCNDTLEYKQLFQFFVLKGENSFIIWFSQGLSSHSWSNLQGWRQQLSFALIFWIDQNWSVWKAAEVWGTDRMGTGVEATIESLYMSLHSYYFQMVHQTSGTQGVFSEFQERSMMKKIAPKSWLLTESIHNFRGVYHRYKNTPKMKILGHNFLHWVQGGNWNSKLYSFFNMGICTWMMDGTSPVSFAWASAIISLAWRLLGSKSKEAW